MRSLNWILLLVALPMTACASSPAAVSPPSGASPSPVPVIDGKTINPEVERLDYIDPRYFGMSEAYAECVDTPAYTASMLEGCASDEWQLQQVRLAAVETALIDLAASYADVEGASFFISKGQLERSYVSWNRHFEDDCNLRDGRWGSTWGPATSMKCNAESTAMRAQQLEDYLLSVRKQLMRNFGDAVSGAER